MHAAKHKLSEEFLSTYPDYPDCMDELGKFVYIRTYSRWLPDKNNWCMERNKCSCY